MMLLICASLLTFAVSIILIPKVKKIALRYDVVAKPNNRTIHSVPIALLGGIGVYFAYITGIFLIFLFAKEDYKELLQENLSFILGGTLILLLGIYDDIKGANCYQKFIVQILAAIVVIYAGYQINSIVNPFGGLIELGWLSIPLTILWLVAISNAFNLIDGLDGLATGVGLGASLTMMVISLWNGNLISALPAGILASALAGFLIFNFNPAKIFLGDSGSLVIGFWLACFSINGTFRTSSAIAILIPIVIFSLPLLDTLIAIIRRLWKGVHPFKADRQHIHHRLLYMGFSQRQAALLLNGISYFWGAIAFSIVVLDNKYSLFLSALVLFPIFIGLTGFGFFRYSTIRGKNSKT